MKIVSYEAAPRHYRAGLLVNAHVYDVEQCFEALCPGVAGLQKIPWSVLEIIRLGQVGMDALHALHTIVVNDDASIQGTYGNYLGSVSLVAPLPHPPSMRDGYAFRQHVEAARRNRGLDMIPEFDEIPIFYFTNHQAVTGPGLVEVEQLHCNQLDFELECAIVIGKTGKNISASEADDYIAGYTIMNDWSARALQMQEMKLNLGPAKGKDFATSIGPWLVTPDELESRKIASSVGNRYDLAMTCEINGEHISHGNVKDMTWTFAQIIERASYGVTLYPGDVIGSGTCGTGCFLELNGSKVYNPARWVEIGDVVECHIDMLGTLSNTVVAARHSYAD